MVDQHLIEEIQTQSMLTDLLDHIQGVPLPRGCHRPPDGRGA